MQEIVIIGTYMDKDSCSSALDTCLMTNEEIKNANIKENVKIVSLEAMSNQELKKMVDQQGNSFISTSPENYHGLDDPFPEWVH